MRRVACLLGMLTACAGGEGRVAPPVPPVPVAASTSNPFDGATFYVNPDYVAQVERAAAAAPALAPQLRKVERYPSAIWIDTIDRARSVSRYLDDAAKKQAALGTPVLVVFALYDVPNRDCAAASSAGELSVDQDGERRYRTEFVDRIADEFASHTSLRIAAILEPDSLANVATNLDHPKCAAADGAYRRSIAYAIHALSKPNVSLYLDAAHAGWLGWEPNREKIARVFADVISLAGGEGSLRGFATNVSNYNSLSRGEGAKLEPSDPCPDELSYVRRLGDSLGAAGVRSRRFVIDTSRNGQVVRTQWANWCIIRGAGLGERPRASPADGVDAYYWIKPPGESDGTSDPAAPRFDVGCSSPDSTPAAPQAGLMFPAYLADLVAHANPPL